MSKKLSKLVDLDIDEISVVDRGANQHSLISFSKSLLDGGVDLLEEPMPDDDLVFDDDGQEVFVEELEHGDVVFDSAGNEYVFVEEEEEFSKVLGVSAMGLPKYMNSIGMTLNGTPARYAGAGLGPSSARESASVFAPRGRLRSAYDDASQRLLGSGQTARRRKRVAGYTAAGAGGAALVGGAYGVGNNRSRTMKSLGDSVIEELSKAVTESDRDEVIAKAMDEVEIYKAQASEALAWAEHEHEVRVTEAFISKAADYNLPVAAEILGPILKSIAEVLDEEDLDILDALLSSVSDALYEEIGYVGESSNGSVMDQVDSMAREYVGKSDFSHAQMTTAMFEANPAAYDAYISEMGR